MSTPPEMVPFNLRLSFQKAIKERVETPNTDPNGREYLGEDESAEPPRPCWIDYAEHNYDNSAHTYWARIDWIQEDAGNFGTTIVQIACFGRIETDQWGVEIVRMAELFRAALRKYGGRIKVYDFTSSKTSPTLVENRHIALQRSDGKWGEAESQTQGIEIEGAASLILTYHFSVLPIDYSENKRDYTTE